MADLNTNYSVPSAETHEEGAKVATAPAESSIPATKTVFAPEAERAESEKYISGLLGIRHFGFGHDIGLTEAHRAILAKCTAELYDFIKPLDISLTPEFYEYDEDNSSEQYPVKAYLLEVMHDHPELDFGFVIRTEMLNTETVIRILSGVATSEEQALYKRCKSGEISFEDYGIGLTDIANQRVFGEIPDEPVPYCTYAELNAAFKNCQ